jgi:hypothetical protein
VRNSLLVTLMIAALWSAVLPNAGYAESAGEDLKPLFKRYIEAWNRGDLMAIGSEVYHPPIYIFEAERTATFATAEDIVALLQPLRRELDSAGFSHSELREVSVCELGGDLAFASFHYSRYDQQGKFMGEPIQASAYIARRTTQGWRLVAHVMQVQARLLSCDS